MGYLTATILLFASLAVWADDKPTPHSNELRCEQALDRVGMLRFFRSRGDFTETDDGIWTRVAGRLVFIPDDGGPEIRAKIGNNASHLEIIRKQIGSARFAEIMASPDSGDVLADLLKDLAIAAENPVNIRAAEEIYADVEAVPAQKPLTLELEKQILAVYKNMERLASPMAEWLKPKVLENRLHQTPQSAFNHKEIEKRLGPGVMIYKASKVTVLLSKPTTFLISSGEFFISDNIHSVAQDVLNQLLPKVRFHAPRDAMPGYIVVRSTNGDFKKGRIEFVRKADLGLEDREDYDFTKD